MTTTTTGTMSMNTTTMTTSTTTPHGTKMHTEGARDRWVGEKAGGKGWAQDKLRLEPWYIFFHIFFWTNTDSFLYLQLGLLLPPSQKATMTMSGPNDAYRVVWALSEYFLLLFVDF